MTDHPETAPEAPAGPPAEDVPPPEPAGGPDVPAKFRDPETGEVRVDALVSSYRELERRMGAAGAGVPDAPDGYELTPAHDLVQSDPAVNARLHAAGFTQEQAQLVYDLAGEVMLPMLQEVAGDVEAERQQQRLAAHFGGAERWGEVSRQMTDWGEANLPPATFEALASTYDGVLALHRMMQSHEPRLGRGGGAAGGASESDLKAMMADPRYWRDADPGLVAKVRAGFTRLYPDGE